MFRRETICLKSLTDPANLYLHFDIQEFNACLHLHDILKSYVNSIYEMGFSGLSRADDWEWSEEKVPFDDYMKWLNYMNAFINRLRSFYAIKYVIRHDIFQFKLINEIIFEWIFAFEYIFHQKMSSFRSRCSFDENWSDKNKYYNSISVFISFEWTWFPMKCQSEVAFNGCNGQHRIISRDKR